MRRKIILHLHSSDFYVFFLTNNNKLKKYINFIFSRVDKIVVLCTDWEIKLKQEYSFNHIVRIANPIDLKSEFQNDNAFREDNGTFVLAFVGFLIESKGIRDLLETMKQLRNKGYSKIKLLIAGKGELESFILDFIDKEKLSNTIDYVGWVAGESKDNLYKKSDVFILPSYKEGMPISILEAMTFGLPIISTNISGVPDVISVPRNGFLVSPGKVNEIVDAIMHCYENKDQLITISENNLNDIKDFSAQNIFNQITKVYSDLLN
ncbi:glycosyltransferase family 4 protein [Winogradskyella sp.]|uniref:glycosyltransferase family 4 protein n=1 Tax=Winogradskyella sp. TaxID=1883156 RepID=UPI002616DD0A|nr:glycosyltransferase family 4 protein [Winogradskyella sp.]